MTKHITAETKGHHFAEELFKCFILILNLIWIKISMAFVPKTPINNIPALVGTTPISEPIMLRIMTHISVTRPQSVKITKSEHLPDSHRAGTRLLTFYEVHLDILRSFHQRVFYSDFTTTAITDSIDCVTWMSWFKRAILKKNEESVRSTEHTYYIYCEKG